LKQKLLLIAIRLYDSKRAFKIAAQLLASLQRSLEDRIVSRAELYGPGSGRIRA